MAEQDLIKTARGVVDAFNAGDWEGCKAALASDSVYDEVATSRRIQGAVAIIPCWQAWKQAMPDVKGTVSHAFASGNTVVLEVTWAGTQTGSLQGPSGTVPPTGKRQTTRASWVLNFDGGKDQGQPPLFRHACLPPATRCDTALITTTRVPSNQRLERAG